MLAMKYSGVLVSRDKVDYGLVAAGEESVFKLVIADIVDYGVHVVHAATGDFGVDHVERFADAHHAYARLSSARRCHARYMDEVLSYVRSLPRGSRSEQLFNPDPARRAMAEDDVREAMVKSLVEWDGFRAAVVFEASTPFLKADRRIVDLMDRIGADARRLYLDGEAEFLVRVAEAMQEQVSSASPFHRQQVARAKARVAEQRSTAAGTLTS
jgi:hypothetical protein